MKYFRLIGLLSLVVFSFYLTDFVTELAIYSNPLMKTIKSNSESFTVKSVNAEIQNNTIIPGIRGKKINEMESFINMKDFAIFNTNYLVYDSIKPDISIEDNKDKIIISGNKTLRQVSILVVDNKNIQNDIKYTKLISSVDDIDDNENINIASNNNIFNDIDTILNRKDKNKKICILNYSNLDICKENNYYIVKPNKYLNNNNFISELKYISNGDIILIDSNFSSNNFNILINKINGSDIKVVTLSEIIEE